MTPEFFRQNRHRLATELSGGIVVLAAYSAMQRGNDAAFGFEQEANFWWLTGIEEPDWWLIIDGGRGKSWLVAPNVSQARQLFDGSLAHEAAQKTSGVDDVLSNDEAQSMLRRLAGKHSVVYSLGEPPHADSFDFMLNPAPKKLYDRLERTFNSVQDCRRQLNSLRAIKQPEEIKIIKQAVKLTTEAFEYVKSNMNDYQYEYEIEADFTHFFRSRGSRGHAYDPIVAAGKNACTLHYSVNDQRISSGALVLLDVGARFKGYASDITRTYAHGRLTKRQAEVHASVSSAHEQIIKLLKPDLAVDEYQRQVDEIMQQALMQLGLLKEATDEQAYRKYFPHAISHGLGVDVHDSLGRPKALQPGMVLTVEPGIYIPEEKIGVRIEDDILITDKGHVNLSANLSTGS